MILEPAERRTTTLYRILLIGITLMAFALRLYRLDAQSLWYDEGVTADIAQRSLAELTRWTADDIQPPLYYYLVAALGRLAGWSEWSLRFPSAAWGTLLVPLLAAVAAALSRRRAAGVLAALLGALHPLLVYYSQEARMYAMLTALGVLLGYLVLQARYATVHQTRYWVAYVLVATAAIYTHYFAFFLLLALATAYVLDQALSRFLGRRVAPRDHVPSAEEAPVLPTPVARFVFANVAVLVLYTPWFAALFTQLTVDASYWEGSFKLLEALRHIVISFIGGETVMEVDAARLLLPAGMLTALALLLLIWRGYHRARILNYALLWLVLPILGILLLASIVPKFNARYAIIALPGLILIWSAGYAAPLPFLGRGGVPLHHRVLGIAASCAGIGLLVAGFLFADRKWYTDPAFTKAEWRELAEYIRARRQPGEAVLLVSGHAWPVWNYYAPDMPAIRLPEIEILDVNAVLDFVDSAHPLRAALMGQRGAWLVEWQDEIVDPMNIVAGQLRLAGIETELDTQFWQLELYHFTDLNPNLILVEPQTVSNASINFDNQLHLLDYRIASNGDLLLFWQRHPEHQAPLPDLNIVGDTLTADGLLFNRLQDRRPAGYEYPSFRWEPGEVALGRIPAQDWAGDGALPGRYRLRLGVYDAGGNLTGLDVVGQDGRLLGQSTTLDLYLPVPTEGPDAVDMAVSAEIIPDLFAEIALSAEEGEPGQLFNGELTWYADDQVPGDYDLDLRWIARDDGRIAVRQVLPLSPAYPTSLWPDDEQLRTLHQFRVPQRLAPGDYWFQVQVTCAPESECREDPLPGLRAPFRVRPSSRIYVPPPFTVPIYAVFAQRLHLLGIIEPLQRRVAAGDQVALTLVWQALEQLPADYTVTVQWLGADGRPAAQSDLPLPGRSSSWQPQQVELQTVVARVPDEPGDYRMIIAVYDAGDSGQPRLIADDGKDLADVGTVTVLP